MMRTIFLDLFLVLMAGGVLGALYQEVRQNMVSLFCLYISKKSRKKEFNFPKLQYFMVLLFSVIFHWGDVTETISPFQTQRILLKSGEAWAIYFPTCQ